MTTTIDVARHLVIHAIEGDIAPGDMVKAIAERSQQKNFKPDMDLMWDFTNAPAGAMPSVDLRGLMESARASGNMAPRVALVTAHSGHHALASSVEKISGELPMDVKAFLTRSEALEWLAQPAQSRVSTPRPEEESD